MPPSNPRTEYESRLHARRATLAADEARHYRLGNLRVGLFLAGVALLFWALLGRTISGWWAAPPLAMLVVVGRLLERAEACVARGQRAVGFYERGLARLDHRWLDGGDHGLEFLDEAHLYAVDLDIVGKGSLFQLLSIARTERGLETLARWLLNRAEPDEIAARQKAVRELASNLDLREDLAVSGPRFTERGGADALVTWGARSVRREAAMVRAARWVLSGLGLLAVIAGPTYVLAGLGLVTIDSAVQVRLRDYFLAIAALGLVVRSRSRRWTVPVLSAVLDAQRQLDQMAEMLRRLERERFHAPHLASLRAAFLGDATASARVARLGVLASLVDARQNAVMKMIGPILLWDVHVARAVEDWRQRSGRSIGVWLSALGEFEALVSLAGFAWERRDTNFPEMIAGGPRFDAEELHHPLLPIGRAVSNDVSLDRHHAVLVVSGSNMSGKSTFLRTIGVNAVLAQAGAPVCARRLQLSPLVVGASIHIQDSLQQGTSRFYAEISRLSRIMAASRGPVPVLFLIDELLQGTNSHDRLIGAGAVVRALADYGAIGLVTTHDLALARLVDTLGGRAANVHFQDVLEDGRLQFDYRLHAGVVQHSNALALMRSVGLDV